MLILKALWNISSGELFALFGVVNTLFDCGAKRYGASYIKQTAQFVAPLCSLRKRLWISVLTNPVASVIIKQMMRNKGCRM